LAFDQHGSSLGVIGSPDIPALKKAREIQGSRSSVGIPRTAFPSRPYALLDLRRI